MKANGPGYAIVAMCSGRFRLINDFIEKPRCGHVTSRGKLLFV